MCSWWHPAIGDRGRVDVFSGAEFRTNCRGIVAAELIAMTTISIWNPQIVKRAIVDAFLKLHPRRMMRNPVMFVVEVGSVLTTLQLIRGLGAFELQITLWLWFTVFFANFAEAMAEGRGKAQADNLRKSKTETIAHRIVSGSLTEDVPAPQLRKDDLVIVSAGEFIPGDGEIVEGVASV